MWFSARLQQHKRWTTVHNYVFFRGVFHRNFSSHTPWALLVSPSYQILFQSILPFRLPHSKSPHPILVNNKKPPIMNDFFSKALKYSRWLPSSFCACWNLPVTGVCKLFSRGATGKVFETSLYYVFLGARGLKKEVCGLKVFGNRCGGGEKGGGRDASWGVSFLWPTYIGKT